MFDLVVEKLTEILHIQLAFRRIRNCGKAVQFHPGFSLNSLNSADDIRQFAHAGWFNNNPIRLKLFRAFFQGLRKVADQTAADASGIHFLDLHAGFL